MSAPVCVIHDPPSHNKQKVWWETKFRILHFIAGMNWDVPPLKQLWMGMSAEDNNMRLKAFLTCMRCDTSNLSDTAMVPQRLMILCCVLRYLVQQVKRGYLIGQNFAEQNFGPALSDEIFSSVSYFPTQFTKKICFNIRFVLIWHVLNFSGQNFRRTKFSAAI